MSFWFPWFSGYLVWKIRKYLSIIEKGRRYDGLLLFIAVLFTIRFLSGLSLITTIFGIILYLLGWKFTNKIKLLIAFYYWLFNQTLLQSYMSIDRMYKQMEPKTYNFIITVHLSAPVNNDTDTTFDLTKEFAE